MMREDTLKKAEQISRMLWQGYRRRQVARMMQLSYEGLIRIIKTPEFQQIDERVREQVLGKMDRTLDRRTDVEKMREELHEEMEDAIPEAWRILMDNLQQRRDLRTALEVLDRDPERQFAKGGLRPQQQTTQVGVGVKVQIDSQALAQAVKEASHTHELIDRATSVKPGEA